MQKIQQVQSMKRARGQKGFTIIELVVVILLLGILAATALPRFMDVTDEAHDSVVSSLEGGLSTGVALFRAQWIAKGQPMTVAVPEFGAEILFANAAGYPVGDSDTFNENSCIDIYNGVLQSGRPPAVPETATTSATPADIDGLNVGDAVSEIMSDATAADIETAADGRFDVVVVTGTGALYCVNNGITAACTGTTFYDTIDNAVGGDGTDGIYASIALGQAAQIQNGSCTLYYTGQYKVRQDGLDALGVDPGEPIDGLETLTLSLTNGEVGRSVTAFEL